MLTRSLLALTFPITALCMLVPAQIQLEKKSSVISGYSGQVMLGRMNGRACVYLEHLVRVANGSLGFQGDQINLTLPATSAEAPTSTIDSDVRSRPRLSQDFVRAGIETTTEMREWASALAYLIQNGYGVTECFVTDQREQTSRALNLAKVTASTSAERDTLQLLNNEFNTVCDWSEKLFHAKKSMDTAKYAVSPEALRNEPLSQKIMTCGRSLDRMLVGGEYRDDPSSH